LKPLYWRLAFLARVTAISALFSSFRVTVYIPYRH
jgi:hypothetical protein